MIDVSDSLMIRALKRQPTSRTPAWMMRQAGRYLPEYRQVRAQAGDFLTLCKTPELACEVTLQPLRRFPLDAAILFSDILTIPDAMGLGLHFTEGEGPAFDRPLRDAQAIRDLAGESVLDELSYVMDAVTLIRRSMPADLPLIGFSGSPWTLACYMVEGGSSKDFKHMLALMYDEPATAHHLLSHLADVVAAYLLAQIAAGANIAMIFDTWGGLLSTANYQHFSLAYMGRIVQRIKEQYPDIPVVLFTKGGAQWLSAMADTGCDALGVDWMCDLAQARTQVGTRVALQGNLDPAIMRAAPEVIRAEVGKVLSAFGSGSGHVFNLGHGITPDVPPEHVAVMLAAVQELSTPYHDHRVNV